jgi:hypothetical protein
LGERILLLLFSGGLFSGGLFDNFFGGHSFYFFGLPNFRIFSFSEGEGIMLLPNEFVNGGKQNFFRRGAKLIACYWAHLVHTVRYVI